jgi:hypothetical protein
MGNYYETIILKVKRELYLRLIDALSLYIAHVNVVHHVHEMSKYTQIVKYYQSESIVTIA